MDASHFRAPIPILSTLRIVGPQKERIFLRFPHLSMGDPLPPPMEEGPFLMLRAESPEGSFSGRLSKRKPTGHHTHLWVASKEETNRTPPPKETKSKPPPKETHRHITPHFAGFPNRNHLAQLRTPCKVRWWPGPASEGDLHGP